VTYLAAHYQVSLTPVRVAAVAKSVGVGRRDSERSFRRSLSRSFLYEIHRVRVERAQDLLAGTSLPLSAVAARCGFASPERMTVVFGQATGTTPTAYRRRVSVQGV